MPPIADDGDLPPPGVVRWVVRRKAAVICAVRAGRIALDEALRRYDLTRQEFAAWERAVDQVGIHGLRVTRLQVYRELRDHAAGNSVKKVGFIEATLRARRSLEGALGDLTAKYENQPTPDLARMIRQLEFEIAIRNGCEAAAQ